MNKKLNIVQVSPEAAPFAKTGGLADVVGALPLAEAELGHQVMVVMPLHRQVRKGRRKLTDLNLELSINLGPTRLKAVVYQGTLGRKVPTYFIGIDDYFDRAELYGTPQGDYPDNAERFSFFCWATLELLSSLKMTPDVIHCHDWQSGLVPVYQKLYFRHLSSVATLLTVHNLAYQGVFPAEKLPATGLPWDLFHPGGVEFYGKISFLKAGLIFADLVNTVSEGYSREIQTAEYGCGLEGVLAERRDRLFGILNGVDYKDWNPATDKFLAANYTPENLAGKARCKQDLLKEFGLTGLEKKPLLGMISRLAEQKGFDLLEEAAPELLSLDLGLVILGTGDEKYQNLLKELAKAYPGKLGVKIAFDNKLAHKIEAGADIFLMPSRYEPCGLNQIYSLRYGTIPLVRATGGLDDSIEEFDPATGQGTGLKFANYDARELLQKVKEALEVYLSKPAAWKRLMTNAMACDFSWERSAQRYVELYMKALPLKVGGDPI